MGTSKEGEAMIDFLIDFVVPLVACSAIGLIAAECVACWIESYGEDGK